jgi:hypothetical protein
MEAPFGLGGIPRPADRRDYKLGLSQAPVTIPAVFMPDHSQIPVKMQGPAPYGTCGGHAGAMLISILDALDLSPKYLWKQIRAFLPVNIPLEQDQGGTDMRTIFQTLQQVGDCREALLPNDLAPLMADYTNPSKLTDEQRNDAYPHGITSYAFTDHPSWEQLRQTIYQSKAVIALVDCGDGWWANGWSQAATCPLKFGNPVDQHFVVLWGYDDKYIYFRNSWSTAWGRNGDGYFDRSYLPHVQEIATAIAGPSIKQQVVSLYTSIILLLKRILALRSAPPSPSL